MMLKKKGAMYDVLTGQYYICRNIYIYIFKTKLILLISTNNLLIYPPDEPLIGVLIKTKLIS